MNFTAWPFAILAFAFGCNQRPDFQQDAKVQREPRMKFESDNKLLTEARRAIQKGDYGELDALRESKMCDILAPLLSDYDSARDWSIRDAIIFLVQDVPDAPGVLHATCPRLAHDRNAGYRCLFPFQGIQSG